MDPASEAPASLAFGRFQVLPHRRELLADGRPIKLGGRAFDVLIALIEARGAVIGKDALMARVWPDRIVEENNLQAQISALPAAFGTRPPRSDHCRAAAAWQRTVSLVGKARSIARAGAAGAPSA